MTIITRKIQIYVDDSVDANRKKHYATIREWNRLVRTGANILLSYLYGIDNLKYKKFITDKSKIELEIIGAKGEPVKESGAHYVLLSNLMKGKIPMDIPNCLRQIIEQKYKKEKKEISLGHTSLPSYRNTIPIPFSAKSINGLCWSKQDKHFKFKLFGIPFATYLGVDRSNNRAIIDRVLSGEYKLCGSAIRNTTTAKKERKTFLLFTIDIPQTIVELKDKKVFASLDIEVPIKAIVGKSAPYFIGSKEEFLYRRLQIQNGLHRLQKACKYNDGGNGRKAKLQALERYKEKEINYVTTRLHTYSRILVNYAIHNRCNQIILVDQEEKEKKAKKEKIEKENDFVLRNWSYYGLIELIKYKAEQVGITVTKEALISTTE